MRVPASVCMASCVCCVLAHGMGPLLFVCHTLAYYTVTITRQLGCVVLEPGVWVVVVSHCVDGAPLGLFEGVVWGMCTYVQQPRGDCCSKHHDQYHCL